MASFKNLISNTSAQIASGGTITGDLVINGDLQVDGGGSLSFDEIIEGTQVIDVTSTEALLVRKNGDGGDIFIVDTTNGSVFTADGISHIGDTDTRMYMGDDDIQFLVGNVAMVRMLENGSQDEVIINEDQADVDFRVESDGNAHALFVQASTGDVGIGMTPASRVSIKANGDTSTVLDIHGRSSDDFAIISFKENASQTVKGQIKVDGSDSMIFRTGASTDALTIDSSQNATFAGDVKVTDNLIIDSTAGNPANQKIQFHDDNVGLQRAGGSDRTANGNSLYISAFEDIVFSASGAVMGSQAERMRIASDGHIGINSTDPTFFFTAIGDATGDQATINQTHASYAGSALKIGAVRAANSAYNLLYCATGTSAAGTGGTAQFVVSGDGNATLAGNINLADNKALTLGSDSDAQIWNDGSNTYVRNNTSDQDIIFQVNDGGSTQTEVMRIDASSSSVGIGVAAPYNLLHIRKSAVTNSDAHDDDLLVIEETGDHCNINMISSVGSYLMWSDATRNAANINYQHSSGAMGVTSETTVEFSVASGTRFKLDANSRISLSNNDSSGAVGTTLFGYNAGLNIVSGAVSNTFIGHEVADATLTNAADYNTGVGGSALSALTSGYSNAAFGFQSLFSNTDGFQNTAIGTSALYHNAGTDNNTAVGDQAGFYTQGASNTYLGQSAGKGTAGADAHNVGVGANALLAITSATYNTSVGSGSGDALTTGAFNTSIGAVSLSTPTIALNNTAIGFNAMSDVKAGVAVDGCVAIGKGALVGNANNTTGINNTVAVGTSALSALTSGAGNLAIGFEALKTHTTGAKNMAIGYQAMLDTNAGSTSLGSTENIFIGYQTGSGTWADSATSYNTGIGNSVMRGACNGAIYNTGVGYQSLKSITDGGFNVALGSRSGEDLTTGDLNTFVGDYAGHTTTNAQRTVAIGHSCMASANVTADAIGTVAVGYEALNVLTSAIGGTAVGYRSGLNATTAEYSTALGYNTLGGNSSTALTGNRNTVIGASAGRDMEGASEKNTLVGDSSGIAITTGNYNTCIGQNTDPSAVTGVNQTVIGYAATGQADNSVTLGNASVTAVYMAQDSGAIVHTAGIQFPATQVASGGANVLDDYEEGTGSPTVSLTGSGSVTLGTSAGNAWTKVGNIVHFQFEFSITGVSSPVGALTVALPFASAGTYYSAGSLRVHSETFDGSPFIEINPSSSVAQLKCNKTGSGTTDITPTAGTRYFFGQITYRAA